MEEKDLLRKNFEYFENELLPYYILLHTSKNTMVIKVQKENLKHLLGVSHVANIKFNSIRPIEFYNNLQNYKYNLFNLIDESRFKNNNLFYDEKIVYQKNYYFKEAFTSLLSTPNIYIYKRDFRSGYFQTDFVHVQINENIGLYVGIVGDEFSNYHYFNSVLAEYDNPKKYLTGPKIKVTKIEKITTEEFCEENFNFFPSKNYKPLKEMSQKKSGKVINLKALLKKINEELNPNLKISIGRYGKNSIQVYKNDTCIETKEKIPYDLLTAKEIAQYLLDKYV